MGTTRKVSIVIVALATGLGVAACGSQRPVADLPMPPTSGGTAVMHAVSNEQLRDVMRGLTGGSFDRMPQELDDPSRELIYLEEASFYAQELVLDADRIRSIVDQIGLDGDKQQIFLRLAERLRDRASQLREQADLRQTRLINATMTEINDTCAACHTLFRDVSQPPSAGTS